MGILSAPFWCLCQKLSLSPLYFNKTLFHKSLSDPASSPAPDWIRLLQRPRIPRLIVQQQPFTLMLGVIGGRRRRGGDRGWDGWMASPTWWAWVWVNSGNWWWTGRLGVLRFMGSQRVGNDWVTELNWTIKLSILKSTIHFLVYLQSVPPLPLIPKHFHHHKKKFQNH